MLGKAIKVRIEYSQDQQWLRIESGIHAPNTNGFITIKESIDEELADEFCSMCESLMDQESDYTNRFVKTLFDRWLIRTEKLMANRIQHLAKLN